MLYSDGLAEAMMLGEFRALLGRSVPEKTIQEYIAQAVQSGKLTSKTADDKTLVRVVVK